MIQHLEPIAATAFTAGLGLMTGAVVATGLPDASLEALVGAVVGGALTLGAAAAAKNWAEKQISKLIEMPTKKELFDKIDAVGTQVATLEKLWREEISPIKERVARIEERHATIDREGGRD